MIDGPFVAVSLPAALRLAGAPETVSGEPGEAALATITPTAGELASLLTTLGEGGERLADVPVRRIAETLGAVGARFLTPGDALREEALERLPGHARVSAPQARYVLEGMARDWTAARLDRLLREEFRVPDVLDGFRTVIDGAPPGRRLRARGPRLALHIVAGTVPGVSVTSLIRGLLVKGAVLLKPGAGDAILPVLFHGALAEADEVGRALHAASAVLYWRGGTPSIEDSALAAADQVVVYGGDVTVADLRGRLRPGTAFVDYPHRVSVAVVGPEADPAESAPDLARAIAAFDQRGCVSLRQLLVLGGETGAGERWGEALAAALEHERSSLPPGRPTAAEAAAVQQLRGAVEMRAAAGESVTLHVGEALSWTVVVDAAPRFAPGCGHRTIHVTALADALELETLLRPVARHLQTVALTGFGPEADAVSELLARLGASRIVPPGEVPFPPAWWLHDGRGPLRRLVRWSESAALSLPLEDAP